MNQVSVAEHIHFWGSKILTLILTVLYRGRIIIPLSTAAQFFSFSGIQNLL